MKKFFKILFMTLGGLIGVVTLLMLVIHFSANGKILLPVKHTP